MRKTKKVTETKIVEKTSDIICNKCGVSCKVGNSSDRWSKRLNKRVESKNFAQNDYDGILEYEVHGGYFSTLLGDMTSYRFSVCAACLLDLFKTFKVPVEIKDDNTGREYVSQDRYKEVSEKTRKAYQKWEKKLISEQEKRKKSKE